MTGVTVVAGVRSGPERPRPAPLWAWPIAGVAIGFAMAVARLAVGRAVLVGVAIICVAVLGNPWVRRRRRLDQLHETVAATRPLLR